MNQNEFVNGLNLELETLGNRKVDKEKIFETFETYVRKKDNLKKVVAIGGLVFEYNKFIVFFKDSIFESYLLTLVDCFHNAVDSDKEKALEIYKTNYLKIALGLKNMDEMIMLHQPEIQLSRTDLYIKYMMRNLEDVIEGTFKTYLKFYYDLYNLSIGKKTEEKDLGIYVQSLCKWKDDFLILLKSVLFGIEINQWRNIAAHHSYKIVDDYYIEITYGKNKPQVEVITKRKLEELFIRIDCIGYLFKTAKVLIGLDYLEEIDIDEKSIKVLRRPDNLISEVVGISYQNGFKVLTCNKTTNEWVVEVCPMKNCIMKEDTVLDYLVIISNILQEDVNFIISFRERTICKAIYKEGILKIEQMDCT